MQALNLISQHAELTSLSNTQCSILLHQRKYCSCCCSEMIGWAKNRKTGFSSYRKNISFAWWLRSALTQLGTKAHAPYYLQEKNARTFSVHMAKYSCSQFPGQLVRVYFDTDMHSKSISLVPAAGCGSEGAEEKGEEDRQPEHPGGAATSEVIFFPWLSSLTISHLNRPSL